MGLAESRTASKMRPAAAGPRFRAWGLIKGSRMLVWFRSGLEHDELLAVFVAGLAVGSGASSEFGTCGAAGWVFVAATGSPGCSFAGSYCCRSRNRSDS